MPTVITVRTDAFDTDGVFQPPYTGEGEDKSPALFLSPVSKDAVSIAVLMTDDSLPFPGGYPHWLIWNLPPNDKIPEGIPHGPEPAGFPGAKQGVGYGKNRYRGPKPPLRFMRHNYTFHVYVLDCQLNLPATATRKELLLAMERHILQWGTLTGRFH